MSLFSRRQSLLRCPTGQRRRVHARRVRLPARCVGRFALSPAACGGRRVCRVHALVSRLPGRRVCRVHTSRPGCPSPSRSATSPHAEVSLGVCAFAFGLPNREAHFVRLVAQTSKRAPSQGPLRCAFDPPPGCPSFGSSSLRRGPAQRLSCIARSPERRISPAAQVFSRGELRAFRPVSRAKHGPNHTRPPVPPEHVRPFGRPKERRAPLACTGLLELMRPTFDTRFPEHRSPAPLRAIRARG